MKIIKSVLGFLAACVFSIVCVCLTVIVSAFVAVLGAAIVAVIVALLLAAGLGISVVAIGAGPSGIRRSMAAIVEWKNKKDE